MYYPEHQVISVHIPKTAGNSIARGLAYNGFAKTPLLKKHAKAQEYREVVGNRVWEECFTFALVRNPWDLMVSSYNWWLQKASKYEQLHQEIEAIRQLGSFPAFINSIYGSMMLNEYYGSIVDWICDCRQKVIVEFVGKFESLDDDWSYICKRLSLKDTTLPHTNQTSRLTYQDYYDTKSKKIVEQRFEWAINQFGYTF
ncbi:MAG: sulfotransferase family protein [Symploca sp. SIO2E9]|nr:sulfotransferase family protein [Symploca sp. SIO2E9]